MSEQQQNFLSDLTASFFFIFSYYLDVEIPELAHEFMYFPLSYYSFLIPSRLFPQPYLLTVLIACFQCPRAWFGAVNVPFPMHPDPTCAALSLPPMRVFTIAFPSSLLLMWFLYLPHFLCPFWLGVWGLPSILEIALKCMISHGCFLRTKSRNQRVDEKYWACGEVIEP